MTGGKKQEIELQNYWFVCFSVFLHLRCVLVCLVLCVCVSACLEEDAPLDVRACYSAVLPP